VAVEPRSQRRRRGVHLESADEGDARGSTLEEPIDERLGLGVRPVQIIDEDINAPRTGQRRQDANERIERPRAAHGSGRPAPSREHGKRRRREREVAAEIGVRERVEKNAREGVDRGVEHVVLDVLARAAASDEHEPSSPARPIGRPAEHSAFSAPRRLRDEGDVERAVGDSLEPRREPAFDVAIATRRARDARFGHARRPH
jgi:hypothetical protein